MNRYLGADLADWGSWHSELWGNDKVGHRSGFSSLIFDMNGSEVLTNRHIINHLICVLNRYKSLSLKDKVFLFIDNKGGVGQVLIFLFWYAFVAFAMYPCNLLPFMMIWLSLTITTAVWNY